MAKILEYRELLLADLLVDKGQVRTQDVDKEIDQLAESIRRQGLFLMGQAVVHQHSCGTASHFLFQTIAQRMTSLLQVVVRLQSQPEAFGSAEVAGEAKRGVCRHCAPFKHNLVDPAGRHIDVARHAVLA